MAASVVGTTPSICYREGDFAPRESGLGLMLTFLRFLVTVNTIRTSGERWSLKDAASELGVSYWTARRLFIAENVERYSTAGDAPVYPATPLKRFQRVRMTYLITDADIDRVKQKMRGEKH